MDKDAEIDPRELKIEVWPSRPPGGQHVGMYSRGVKITHLPTNTVAVVEAARSQHVNKMIAMEMILSAIAHPRMLRHD